MNPLFSLINEQIRPAISALPPRVKPLQRSATASAFVLNKVPRNMQRWALEPFMNHALAVLVNSGELDFLTDKACSIAVKDTDQQWVFSLVDGQLTLLDQAHADVTVSATIPAFIKLVSQQADPDALFFKRELSIEGDVELGLYVKNMLDALDEDDLPTIWRTMLSHLRKLINYEAQTTN